VRAGLPSSSGLRRLHQAFLLHRLLVAAAHLADDVLQPLLDRLEIGQHQLGLDGLGVLDGIDAALHMGHVTVLEAAQDMGDGIDLADIGEELVAEPLPLSMTRIDDTFARLKAEGKKAFVAYVMAGDPDYETSLEIVRACPARASISSSWACPSPTRWPTARRSSLPVSARSKGADAAEDARHGARASGRRTTPRRS
jgi:hypothetical protein